MPEEAKRPSVLMTDEQKLIELDNVISTHSDNVDVASVNKLVDKYGAYAYDIVYKALDPVNLVEHTDGQYRNTRYTISYFANNDISSDKLAAIVGYDDAQKIEGKLVQYEAAKKAKKVDEAYSQACGGDDKDKISIQDLMKQANVKGEDFQAVCNDCPELLGEIGGGKSCEALAKAADVVKTKYVDGKAQTGMCKSGVDAIHRKAVSFGLPKDSLHTAASVKAIDDYRKKRPYQGASNGGCNIYAGLESSNDYVTVAVKNEAYCKSKGCTEDKKMNSVLLQCQPGVTVTIDAVEDRNISQAKTAGGKWGHTVVRANKTKTLGRPWACDFEQGDINFSRYGEYAHICFPKDAYVSKDYAKMIIAKAQERQAKEQAHESSVQIADKEQIKQAMKSQQGELAEDKTSYESAQVDMKAGRLEKRQAERNVVALLENANSKTQSVINEDGKVQTVFANKNSLADKTAQPAAAQPTASNSEKPAEKSPTAIRLEGSKSMSVEQIKELLQKRR